MVNYKLGKLMLVVMISLLLVACKSNSSDVASLNNDDTQPVQPTAIVEEKPPDDDSKMMAFTQCMRDEGIELVDAGVDSEGNVQRPTLAEGVQVTREEFGQAMEVCDQHLEGLTLGRERQDVSEVVDQMVALASCLCDKGYDIDDPTAETLDQWRVDFQVEFDWDDPEAQAAYEECNAD